jgi:hypothetical protein
MRFNYSVGLLLIIQNCLGGVLPGYSQLQARNFEAFVPETPSVVVSEAYNLHNDDEFLIHGRASETERYTAISAAYSAANKGQDMPLSTRYAFIETLGGECCFGAQCFGIHSALVVGEVVSTGGELDFQANFWDMVYAINTPKSAFGGAVRTRSQPWDLKPLTKFAYQKVVRMTDGQIDLYGNNNATVSNPLELC